MSPTAGTVTLASGSIIDSVGFGSLQAAAYVLQGGIPPAASSAAARQR